MTCLIYSHTTDYITGQMAAILVFTIQSVIYIYWVGYVGTCVTKTSPLYTVLGIHHNIILYMIPVSVKGVQISTPFTRTYSDPQLQHS